MDDDEFSFKPPASYTLLSPSKSIKPTSKLVLLKVPKHFDISRLKSLTPGQIPSSQGLSLHNNSSSELSKLQILFPKSRFVVFSHSKDGFERVCLTVGPTVKEIDEQELERVSLQIRDAPFIPPTKPADLIYSLEPFGNPAVDVHVDQQLEGNAKVEKSKRKRTDTPIKQKKAKKQKK